ncbi:PPE domain-containing protein [Mycobacterium paragordonae]|uniref:PPE domain-containing protein n=1 Tax=Mycobacterium paragordonae TaxID=1389713 RepID=A0ABQ1CG81_9MYCO|nr:PPE domain-containing protein [Mycobacterium paragordonae]GFG83230.1 hypothetical protein MPRG_65060 [Mycobacterium paragordonae]
MTSPWAATPPEANYLLLARGAGEATTVAAGAAWQAQTVESVVHAEVSQVNTAVTGVSWVGAGGGASALSATTMNGVLEALSGWAESTVPITEAAAMAFRAAVTAMIPDVLCTENRVECAKDVAINPLVWGALTPDIVRLDGTYYGPYWTENASQGILFETFLLTAIPMLQLPPPVGPLSASPGAPVAAAAQVAQATADGAIGDSMRESTAAGMQITDQMGSGGGSLGSAQSLMEPVMSAAQLPMQSLSSPVQSLQSATSPLQSMLGMFSMGGAGGGVEPAALATGGAEPLAGAAARGGAAAMGGGSSLGGTGALSSYPVSSYTRPAGSFSEGGAASYAKPGAGGVASAPVGPGGVGAPMGGMLHSGAGGKGPAKGDGAKAMRLHPPVNSATT